MDNQESINAFTGEHRFLSNFYRSPFMFKGKRWSTVEQAYQAEKAADEEGYQYVVKARTPGEARRRGQKVRIRDNWDNVRRSVMWHLLWHKFTQNGNLRDELENTYPTPLVEENHWGDTYWGVCNGEGENQLGKLLMSLRDIFVANTQSMKRPF